MCPGNCVSFICQQSGALARWRIFLPSVTLQNVAFSTQLGSLLTFVNDPGFNFEIHIISNSSGILTTELQATAVRELNGVTVECFGQNGTIILTIFVTSIGEFMIILLLKILQFLQVESW